MQQHTVEFNRVLQEIAVFYTQISQIYHMNYGVGTVSFAHIPATEQIHLSVNIPSQYGLTVYLTVEHRQGQWCINGTLTDMQNIHSLLNHLFRRVHIGTIKMLEFLESKRTMKDWRISYDENNTIHITERGMECAINVVQDGSITEMSVSGVFETGTHKTSFTSLDDVKSLVGTTNTLMDTSQNWAMS